MRHESFVLALAFALLAGCASGGGARADKPKAPAREISHNGQINLSLAQTYMQEGKLETALERANRALASDPGSGNVHAMLGLVYDRIGDQARAASSFQRAIQLSPNAGGVLNAYGTWLCAHGDTAGAASQFARALADPFFTSTGLAHFNAGHCLMRAGQHVQAEASLRRALTEPGADLSSVLMSLAQTTLAQGRLLEARAFVQRRESMGVTPEVLELAARIEDASGDRAAAARYRARIEAANRNPSPSGGESQR